jgi:hypothetical protein
MPKCYNCGSLHHYSDHCSKPAKENRSKCHNCQQTGHKMTDCPLNKVQSGSFAQIFQQPKCHNCQQLGHKMADCPLNKVQASSFAQNFQQPKCHNCQQLGHKMADCPNKDSQKLACHNCKQFGHKMSDCPLNRSAFALNSKSSIMCHNCGESGHKIAECPLNFQVEGHEGPRSILKNALTVQLRLDGMWGRESALIANSSILYDVHNDFMKCLFEEKIIEVSQSDRDCVPHINIKGNQEIYSELNNSPVIINNQSIKLHRDYIELVISTKYRVHMMLCHSDNLISKSEVIYKILDSVLEKLKTKVDRFNEIKENSLISSKCKVCYEHDINLTLVPCGHTCICSNCLGQLHICPICRTPITSSVKSILS